MGSLMRLEGWESKMAKALEETGAFEWGTNDCCMFVFRVAEAISGVDYAKPYRGYKTAKGAARRLLKHGGVEGVAINSFGEPKKPLLAKRGDAVLVKSVDDLTLGICVGDKIAVVTETGLILISMREAINAWSI